jgi:putative oxidoreductase
MESLSDVAALVGRILLALIFVYSGLGKFMHMGIFVGTTSAHFTNAGVPSALVYPGLWLSAVIELVGGVLMIIGLRARWSAFIIFLWLIPVTLLFHFADYHQAVEQHQVMTALIQQTMLMKNIAIMGGLLVLAAMGPGGLSIDGRSREIGLSPARRAA